MGPPAGGVLGGGGRAGLGLVSTPRIVSADHLVITRARV